MELNLEATGGASDFSRQAELDSSQLNFDLVLLLPLCLETVMSSKMH